MPWGLPDATEPLYCITCGVSGREFRERRFVERALRGMANVRCRVCPDCYDAGWRFQGPGVELGEFYVPQLHRVPPPQPAASTEVA